MENGAIVHHTLGDGKFDHFSNMYREITVAQTNVTPEHAAEEIDRVLRACWNENALFILICQLMCIINQLINRQNLL